MKSYRLILAILVGVMFLTSCFEAKSYEILLYNAEIGEKIEIDNQEIILSKDDMFTSILLKEGLHTFQSNGVFPDSLLVDRNGLLCTGANDFVLFPIGYSGTSKAINLNAYPSGPIILGDSIVIYDNTSSKNQEELVEKMKMLVTSDLKAQNKMENPRTRQHSRKLRKLVCSDNNFIWRRWHYPYGKAPKEISVSSQSLDGFLHDKYSVMDEQTFIIYAKLSDRFNYEKITHEEFVVTFNEYRSHKFAVN